jgi:hypothetical protein
LERATALLDFWLIKALFGSALPLMFAVMSWEPFFGLGRAERRVRFDPLSHAMLSLVATLAIVFMIWSFAQPRGVRAARIFAPLLSLGATIAAWYSMGILAPVGHVLRQLVVAESSWHFLLVLPFAAIPFLACAVHFRQAALAWRASATRAQTRPLWTVTWIVGGLLGTWLLALALSVPARKLALERLRSDRADAVEHALGPLRLAALLGGEDRLLEWYLEQPDGTVEASFDAAFTRLTGQTIFDRESELRSD